MFHTQTIKAAALGAALSLAVAPLAAQNEQRVIVTVENLAPQQGTFQTPFWVGFHDGSFDLYDRNQPADLFFPDSLALERLAEDGDTAPLSADFLLAQPAGIDSTLATPAGALSPGAIVTGSFLIDPADPNQRYFSYASMVIPSNDFFVANGDPLAHGVFDASGEFVGESFFIRGRDVLDAGTEVNDEVPANTAFFGQELPDTGVDEDGVILGRPERGRFLPAGSGGILDDAMFTEADFGEIGYPIAKVVFRAAPAILEDAEFRTELIGANEVPPVDTPALGRAIVNLSDEGTVLSFELRFRNLDNVVGAHLHLGAADENGPVVALLTEPLEPNGGPFTTLSGELTTGSLTGPLTSQPLDALAAELLAGNIYINIHTDDGIDPQNTGAGDFASGEIRGQLSVIN